MKLFNKKTNSATNEFDQVIVGNSLTKDAWRRLKKNKMAVISVVIVTIYILLALTAPILPIYPYDEIILDHQHLPPSFTRNAGDLLTEKRLSDLYTQAWRQGRLEVSEQEEEMLWNWIDNNDANKVWDYMYKKGTKMVEEGTFTYNSSDERKVKKLEDKIRTELQITVKKVWYTPSNSDKRVDINSLDNEEVLALYATMINSSVADQMNQYEVEIEQQLSKKVMSQNPGLSNEEYDALLKAEINGLSELRQ